MGPGQPCYFVTRWAPPMLRPDAPSSDWRFIEVVGAFSSRKRAMEWLGATDRRDASDRGALRLERVMLDELAGVVAQWRKGRD